MKLRQGVALGIERGPSSILRMARYAEKTGHDVSGIAFHHAYGLFKGGVIAQQIYARYRAGKTRDPRFAGLLHVVRAAGRMAIMVKDN